MSKSTTATAASFVLTLAFMIGTAGAEKVPDHGPIPFSAYDANGDGVVTEAEFDAVRARRTQQGGGQGQRQGAGQGRGQGPGRDAPDFQDFDADGDDFISEQEFQEGRARRVAERAAQGRQMKGMADAPSFADIDTDRDGKLSREEFAVHQEARRRSMSK